MKIASGYQELTNIKAINERNSGLKYTYPETELVQISFNFTFPRLPTNSCFLDIQNERPKYLDTYTYTIRGGV